MSSKKTMCIIGYVTKYIMESPKLKSSYRLSHYYNYKNIWKDHERIKLFLRKKMVKQKYCNISGTVVNWYYKSLLLLSMYMSAVYIDTKPSLGQISQYCILLLVVISKPSDGQREIQCK